MANPYGDIFSSVARDPEAERLAALGRIEEQRKITAGESDFYENMMNTLAKRVGVPLPQREGEYYTRGQFENMMAQYPYQPTQEQAAAELMRRRQFEAMQQRTAGQRLMEGAAPILPSNFAQYESTYSAPSQTQNPQGPPMPFGMAFINRVDRNAMRDSLYPYLQMLGLAVGERQR